MGLRILRWVGLLEGLSFVVLLFVAMPLKYIWGEPLAVRYVGIAHGVLFVLLVSLVLQVGPSHGWSWKRCAAGVAAAFVPFGPFFFDRTVVRAMGEAAAEPEQNP
jgi:integral membrane protein